MVVHACFNSKTRERKYKAVTYVRICGLLGSGSAKSFSTNVQLQREVYRKCISAKTEFSDALDHAQERSLLTTHCQYSRRPMNFTILHESDTCRSSVLCRRKGASQGRRYVMLNFGKEYQFFVSFVSFICPFSSLFRSPSSILEKKSVSP